MKIFAVIVTYNPEIKTLKACMESVLPQTDMLLIVDNASANQGEVSELKKSLNSEGKIRIQCNKTNLGVASALNIALGYSVRNHADWLLTLDQDSVVPDGMIKGYIPFTKPFIGQICCNLENPLVPDLPIDKMSPLTTAMKKRRSKSFYSVYACITSGTLLNVQAASSIGGFRDDLFIDYVDYDISLNLLENGYRTLFIPGIHMKHVFGLAEKKNFLGYRYTDYNFTAQREYYKAKNCIYMIKRYPRFRRIFIKGLIYDLMCPVLGFRIKCVFGFIKGFLEGLGTRVQMKNS